LIAARCPGRTVVSEVEGVMSTRKSGLGPTLMVLLSVVVIVQSAALAWVVLVSPDREAIIADLRSKPVETVVALCLPAKG